MKKLHAGSGIPHGTLRGKDGPKPRVYANHGGTNLQQGRVRDAPTRGGAVNAGGTFGMGTLKKRK